MITLGKTFTIGTETVQRILVGAVSIPVILLLIFIPLWHYFLFSLFIVIVIVMSSMEYQQILKYKWISDYKIAFPIMCFLMPAIFWLQTWITVPGLQEMLLVLCFMALVVPQFFKSSFLESFSYIGYYFMGLFFIGWGTSHLISLINLKSGSYYLSLFFISIWISDSLAYFTGTFIPDIKRHKMPWKVSPNKSIEGYIAALAGAYIGVLLVNLLFHTGWVIDVRAFKIEFSAACFNLPQNLLMGFVIFLFAVLGDLFESVLKRSVNMKDSGTLLPGHGGILDRFDSIFLTAPVFTLLVRFLAG